MKKEKNKHLWGFIKRYLGEITLLTGVCIFTSNILDFSYNYGRRGINPFAPLGSGSETIQGVLYYYPDDKIWLITLGAVLIVLGILMIRNKKKEGRDSDELYEEAKQIVIKKGGATASELQRELKIGYARSARLIDMMKDEGIIK